MADTLRPVLDLDALEIAGQIALMGHDEKYECPEDAISAAIDARLSAKGGET